jgi:hypothetical protein
VIQEPEEQRRKRRATAAPVRDVDRLEVRVTALEERVGALESRGPLSFGVQNPPVPQGEPGLPNQVGVTCGPAGRDGRHSPPTPTTGSLDGNRSSGGGVREDSPSSSSPLDDSCGCPSSTYHAFAESRKSR